MIDREPPLRRAEVIDTIEILGRAIDDGRIDPAMAAGIVVDCAEGWLDLADAVDGLRHWKTYRATRDALIAEMADYLLAAAFDLPRGAA